MRIEPVIGRHLDHMKVRNLRESSIRHRLEALARLTAWANGPILYLTDEQLTRWQQDRSRQVSSQTLRTETSHAREFYRWAVKERLIDRDPTVRLVTPAARRGLPRPIGDAHLARAIAEAPPIMAATLGLAAFSGLRACEIAQLSWAELYLAGMPPATLRILEGKGGHTRDVHVPTALVELLRALPDRSGPVIRPMRGNRRYCTPARISQRANEYLHNMGIPETLHQLRHRFATRMYEECRDIRAVQEELGHRSPTTTAIYAAASSETAARAVEAAGHMKAG